MVVPELCLGDDVLVESESRGIVTVTCFGAERCSGTREGVTGGVSVLPRPSDSAAKDDLGL